MTDSKKRLAELAVRISEKQKEGKTDPREPSMSTEANPPHGEKGDFIKVTVTLPPEVYKLIMEEAVRRKIHKERNPQLSAVIREAVVQYLEKKGNQS
jgi:hypothetical protein